MEGARRNHDFSYTPTEAARMLRVSPTRIRQLLQDGELYGERDEAGHWLIPARVVHERLERLRHESFLDAVDYDPSIVHAMQERVEVLRDQVEMLRAELQEAHAANRENRRIIAALTQRIPELEAPQEPPGVPEGAVEDSERAEPRPATGGPQDGYGRPRDTAEFPVGGSLTRPWWRRVFGG
jgi:excisionase family DNA binding protein